MSRTDQDLDGVTINGDVYRLGKLTEPKRGERVHLIRTRPEVKSLCEASYGKNMEHTPDEDLSCPRCKRVLLGRPVEKDQDIIPIDFDYEVWLEGEGPTPEPVESDPPAEEEEGPVPSDEEEDAPVRDQQDKFSWEEEDIRPGFDWRNAEIEGEVDATTICSFTYPNGFRHEQPGPPAEYVIAVRYMFGGRSEQIIRYAVCAKCKNTFEGSEGQSGRAEIVELEEINEQE